LGAPEKKNASPGFFEWRAWRMENQSKGCFDTLRFYEDFGRMIDGR